MATKKDPRDANRRVQFEEAGAGVYLLLRNSGLRTIQGYYDKEHLQVVERAFLTVDIPVIDRLLELMVWKGEEKFELTLDELDNYPLDVIVDKLRDAWSLCLNGRTYLEQVEHIREEARKLTQDPLLTSPAVGSEASADKPTGQG